MLVTGVADLKEVVGSCDQKVLRSKVIIFFLVFFKDSHTLLNQNSNKFVWGLYASFDMFGATVH